MVPLKRITAYDVAVAFVEKLVFKYGAPATLLFNNGSQFVAHFFRRVCNILQVHNIFTTTYHPQTNGQVERFNRTFAAMLRRRQPRSVVLVCAGTVLRVQHVGAQYHGHNPLRLGP